MKPISCALEYAHRTDRTKNNPSKRNDDHQPNENLRDFGKSTGLFLLSQIDTSFANLLTLFYLKIS